MWRLQRVVVELRVVVEAVVEAQSGGGDEVGRGRYGRRRSDEYTNIVVSCCTRLYRVIMKANGINLCLGPITLKRSQPESNSLSRFEAYVVTRHTVHTDHQS